jgi:uncharacterized protein (DUF488 family)
LVDIRLKNVSQLAGFTKKSDLPYFLETICGIDYMHEPLLAPTEEILDDYKKRKGSWDAYEPRFLDLMRERRIESVIPQSLFAVPTVLLCSETTPEHCHRRLVLEYLRDQWGDVAIIHL